MAITELPRIVGRCVGRMNQSVPSEYRVIAKNHRNMVMKRYRNDFDFYLCERMKSAGLVFPDE